MEFASRLHAYRDDRSKLVAKVREVCSRLGYYYLDDARAANGIQMGDICPFTTIGSFNRGIGDEERKQIAKEIGDFLGVKKPTPDSFVGIPVLPVNNSVLYWNIRDVDLLWQAFENAIRLADSSDSHARRLFVDSYNRALRASGVAWNLTIGLYWIRPHKYPTLDSNSRQYMNENLGITFPQLPPGGNEYLALSDDLKKRFTDPDSPVHSFQELSLAAYDPSAYNLTETRPVWVKEGECSSKNGKLERTGPINSPWSREAIKELADELLWQPVNLQDIIAGLKDKGQVIFQGPPGTGKTFVSKRIGEWAKEYGGDYRIVQFHPSYSYEDFVEGYRPTLSGSQAGFELRDGPLKEIAKKAESKPDNTFILVIDEINRTNVSKVLGELYFLLEYREDKAPLLYSKEDFNLPKNLWIIGTMNTTDRSIALVDAALRRRFYFYDFFPDKPPIKGLLRQWLEKNDPEMMKVADLVDRANKALEDRHLSIGPSHFMKKEQKLDKERVRFIWERAVFPYIEEQLFGRQEDIDKYRFHRLEHILDGNT